MKQVKRKVKWKILHGIPKSDLVYFSFNMEDSSFKNLNWKHSKEFEFEGKMFDIVKGDTLNNIVNYYCYPDKQETALNKRLNGQLNLFFARDKESNTKSYQLNHLVTNLFVQQYKIVLPQANQFIHSTYFYKLESKQWHSTYKGPPPKVYPSM